MASLLGIRPGKRHVERQHVRPKAIARLEAAYWAAIPTFPFGRRSIVPHAAVTQRRRVPPLNGIGEELVKAAGETTVNQTAILKFDRYREACTKKVSAHSDIDFSVLRRDFPDQT